MARITPQPWCKYLRGGSALEALASSCCCQRRTHPRPSLGHQGPSIPRSQAPQQGGQVRLLGFPRHRSSLGVILGDTLHTHTHRRANPAFVQDLWAGKSRDEIFCFPPTFWVCVLCTKIPFIGRNKKVFSAFFATTICICHSPSPCPPHLQTLHRHPKGETEHSIQLEVKETASQSCVLLAQSPSSCPC